MFGWPQKGGIELGEGRHVEIAGAGLAGLFAATALARCGWSVRIHERSSELRELGAGIYLWENAVRALESIDALAAITAGAERIRAPELREGKWIAQKQWLSHGRLYTVPRQYLLRCLADSAIDAGVVIETGSEVTRAHPDGRLELASGETVSADLVIGADGVNSKVRESLGIRSAVTRLRDGCSRHLIPRTGDDPKAVAIEAWNGGRRMGVVPCSAEWTYIFLCCPERDAGGRSTAPLNRGEWGRSFPAFVSQLERIPDYPENPWVAFFDVTTTSWVRGRAVLVGDSAHAMSPNLGQAACVAMTNAVALGQALSGLPIEAALREWERSERPVVERVQRYSRFYGAIGTSWPERLLIVRAGFVWALGAIRPLQRRIQFASGYFPDLDKRLTGAG